MKKYILALVLGASFFFNFISVPKVFAEAAAAQVIQEAEIEREKTLIKELTLNIPEQTEDPNYPVTFFDPSKKGVDVTIDGKTTTKALSPLVLPNLAIGEHTIAFSYKNASGEPRYLQKNMLITPKAPIFDTSLKTKIVRPNAVVLQGTALPQSTVMLVLNSSLTHSITTSLEGDWEFIIPEPIEGDNNIIAFTIRNGIVSTPSKVFSFSYALQDSGNEVQTQVEAPTESITSFIATTIEKIDQNRQNDPMFFYGVIGIASLLLILLMAVNMRKKAAKKRDEETIVSLFSKENKKESILNVISESEEQKTSKGKKKTKEENTKKEEPKISKAFANLKQEMGVEEETKEEIKEETIEEESKKRSGLFSLFGNRKKGQNESQKVKEKGGEVPKPPEKKEVLKEEEKQEPKKEVKKTEVEAEKEEKAIELPEEVKKEKTIGKSDIISKNKEIEPKEEEEDKKKVVKKDIKTKTETKKEAKERVIDETEEPEKKVLTKEEFLKQFKSGEED